MSKLTTITTAIIALAIGTQADAASSKQNRPAEPPCVVNGDSRFPRQRWNVPEVVNPFETLKPLLPRERD